MGTDIYKTLEVEVRVPLDAAVTDSDVPSMAKELARDKLKKEAPSLAPSDKLEIILTNVEIRRRGDTNGMAVYGASAEVYTHNSKSTARAVKKP